MKALFVIRHNNDYDSIAPVADGWAAISPENTAHLYFASPEIKWKNDFRTEVLRANRRIVICDFWDISASGNLGGWLDRKWTKVDADRRAQRKFLQLVTESVAWHGFPEKMTNWIDALNPDVIAFDWYPVPAKRSRFGYFGYQEIADWAHSRKRPLVSLPHGLVLYDQPQAKAAKLGAYDAMFVESEQRRRKLTELGGELPEIIVSGSPRYDPSWVERIATRLDADNPAPPPHADGRVTIVYFGKKQVYDFDFARQNDWLGHLADHDRVDLIIQPHPRGQKSSAFASLATRPNVTIDMKTPATALIGRADMVSTLTSSVMVEAVIRGREILYPKFFNTVTTRFEEKRACVALESKEDSHPAIDAWLAGDRVQKANYDDFLQTTVFGGQDSNTIQRICMEMRKLRN